MENTIRKSRTTDLPRDKATIDDKETNERKEDEKPIEDLIAEHRDLDKKFEDGK